MKKTVSADSMLYYLQEAFTYALEQRKKYNDDYSSKLISAVIAQKELVEAMIGEPVNLQKDGKVTVGF